jgi:nitroreductase
MDLDQAISRRRMCRNFLERPVPPETLDRLLAAATRAPSAGNTQGWAFLVLEGDDRDRFWSQQADTAWLEHPSHPGLLRAPMLVVPLASRDRYAERYSEPDKATVGPGRVEQWHVPYWLVDAAFATMLLLLEVTQEGLGALFFALRRDPSPLLHELGAPPSWEALGAVAIGWPSPDDRPTPSAERPRRPVAELVHRGRW